MIFHIALNMLFLWQIGPMLEFSPVSYTHLDVYKRQVREVVLDTDAARTRFGWAPRVDLDAGIARTWRWLQSGACPLPQAQGSP